MQFEKRQDKNLAPAEISRSQADLITRRVSDYKLENESFLAVAGVTSLLRRNSRVLLASSAKPAGVVSSSMPSAQ